MARQPANYSHANQLSAAAEDIIAAVAQNTQEIVRKLSFTNTGTTARTVSVYVVETSGTAGTTNLLKDKAISGGKDWNCIEIQGEVLNPGMSLQASQDTGTDVNVNCSGTTVT